MILRVLLWLAQRENIHVILSPDVNLNLSTPLLPPLQLPGVGDVGREVGPLDLLDGLVDLLVRGGDVDWRRGGGGVQLLVDPVHIHRRHLLPPRLRLRGSGQVVGGGQSQVGRR